MNFICFSEERKKSLKIAGSLRHKLVKHQPSVNGPLYHAKIAAFGRCGDIETVFALLDEMNTKQIPITTDTYCHVLHACISDTKSGFRLAIVVYRLMLRDKNSQPNIHVFKLLVQAANKCGIGEDKVANDLLLEAMTSQQAREFTEKLSNQKYLPTSTGKLRIMWKNEGFALK